MPPAVSRTSDLGQLLRRPALWLWCLYLVLTPFYVVHNGLPQPGDLMILLIVPVALSGWDGRLHRLAGPVLRPLFFFTAWVALVDVAWALILRNFGVDLLFPAYYLYNTLIVLCALVLHARYGEVFLRLTVRTIAFTVAFQVAAGLVLRSTSIRSQLFFSNPNQLGYYALLAGCILALASRRAGLSLWWSSAALLGCAYLALLSASRSAVAGVALLFALLVFSNPRVLAVATVAAVAIMLLGGTEHATDPLQQRLEAARAPTLTFFEQRGYDRIWNNKEYVLLGAGEGANWRFKATTAIGAAEIHSSAGTLVFAYGLVGTAMFVAFLARLLRGAPLRAAIMLTPALIYTFAHQGLRFTSLWVMVAVFIIQKLPQAPPRAAAARPRPVAPLPGLS